jgi:small ligand-binding sensory domain FIST
MGSASSFHVRATKASFLARPLASAKLQVAKASAGVVFVTGEMAENLTRVAQVVAESWPNIPTLITTGSGVMSESGEMENQSAASGLLLAGARSNLFCTHCPDAESLPNCVVPLLEQANIGTRSTALLFCEPERWNPALLDKMNELYPKLRLLGGGTAQAQGVAIVDAQGRISHGNVAGMVLHGLTPPMISVAPATKLLGSLARITEISGKYVTKLDNRPALDVLAERAGNLVDQPLILAYVVPTNMEAEELENLGVLRPIRGMDPDRRAIIIGEQVSLGQQVGFAARDPVASRHNLEQATSKLSRSVAGAGLRFGLYINCAGRGQSLYSVSDVDSKILRNRFANLPIAGVMSSFELASEPKHACMHLFTGIFGLFTSPS